MERVERPPAASRVLLGLAAVAVAFAAADTYVVVLSLPDMMGSVGLGVDQLQRAAPILSGFLLGYVAMLPLVGRVADVRGRTPVLVAALLVFAFGSLVTAAAYDLGSLVTGRFLQGVGGGGLVPVTLALVADLYPAERRGIPLGIVGAVQELGSVLGPLYGAVVLAVGTWRDIFWINLAAGLVLAAAVAALARRGGPGDGTAPDRTRRARPDVVGILLLVLALTLLLLVMRQPDSLVTSVAWGGPFVPFSTGGSVWASPLGAATVVATLALLAWLLVAPRSLAPHPLVDLRGWWGSVREADVVGAGLLAVALGGVILAFATADPAVQVLSEAGPWYLALALVGAIAFVVHSRRVAEPLVPRGSLARRSAWGSLLVSFFVGAALIAALVDVPILARITVADGSQLKSALVLVELLVALPVGALLGGWLVRRAPAGVITAGGTWLAAAGFAVMSGWGPDSLSHLSSSVVLAGTGLGFGLALAPVNAALLAGTEDRVHGVTSALLVVARMVGMLIGVSALTTIGLRRYYAVQTDLPSATSVCGGTSTRCPAYTRLVELAGIEQLQAIFLGACGCAIVAGLLALVCFHGARTRARPGEGTPAGAAVATPVPPA